jgi:hypothetical protein
MPKLTREDWQKLRDHYGVAFTGMPSNLFTVLLDKVFGFQQKSNPGSVNPNPGELDDVDATMVCLAHSEPGIQPQPPPQLATHTEPGIQPRPPNQ